MVRPLSESNIAIKIALLFLVITLIVFVIGFSTPNWTVVTGLSVVRFGLWQHCVEFASIGTICDIDSSAAGSEQNWLLVVRILQCIGLVGIILSTAATVLNVFFVRSRVLKQAAIFISIISGIVVLGGCAFYAIKTEAKNLGYSYLLCICGGGGAILAGLLLCLDRRRDSQSDTEVVYTQQAHYVPGQPAPTFVHPTSGPYGGHILSPPPGHGYTGQGQPQYNWQGQAPASGGYADQGYTKS